MFYDDLIVWGFGYDLKLPRSRVSALQILVEGVCVYVHVRGSPGACPIASDIKPGCVAYHVLIAAAFVLARLSLALGLVSVDPVA